MNDPAYQCLPVEKVHTNIHFTAPGCGDLPATKTAGGFLTIWKCDSLIERIKFLFTGEVSLHVTGEGHPPVSVCVGDIVKGKS